MTNVVLGGTFGPLHDGHRSLMETAFKVGNVTIGVTSEELAQKTRDEEREAPSVEARKENVREEAERLAEEYNRDYRVIVIDDPRSQALSEEYDALVVSPEAKARRRAEEINEQRRENEGEPLEIYVSEVVEAEDGERISSTRIVKGEIDEHGNILG